MKKRFFTAAIACVAAMSLSVAAFAAAPGSTNGQANTTATVKADEAVKIETENGVAVDAPAGAFEGTVVMDTNVQATDTAQQTAVAQVMVNAMATAVPAEAAASLQVNTKISITLTNATGQTVQPNGSVGVTVTIAYDGVSNAVTYVNGNTVEFMALTINGSTASFVTTHFSDFYMVKVDEAVLPTLIAAKTLTDPVTSAPTPDNSGNAGNTNGGATQDKNQATGVVLAVIPAAVAAAAVVISKKRK